MTINQRYLKGISHAASTLLAAKPKTRRRIQARGAMYILFFREKHEAKVAARKRRAEEEAKRKEKEKR